MSRPGRTFSVRTRSTTSRVAPGSEPTTACWLESSPNSAHSVASSACSEIHRKRRPFAPTISLTGNSATSDQRTITTAPGSNMVPESSVTVT